MIFSTIFVIDGIHTLSVSKVWFCRHESLCLWDTCLFATKSVASSVELIASRIGAKISKDTLEQQRHCSEQWAVIWQPPEQQQQRSYLDTKADRFVGVQQTHENHLLKRLTQMLTHSHNCFHISLGRPGWIEICHIFGGSQHVALMMHILHSSQIISTQFNLCQLESTCLTCFSGQNGTDNGTVQCTVNSTEVNNFFSLISLSALHLILNQIMSTYLTTLFCVQKSM